MAVTETDRAAVTERKLRQAVKVHQRNVKATETSYDDVFNLIREASEDGLSYDKIATITKLSKTQIGRILRA